MVKHVVMWNITAQDREAVYQEMRTRLKSLMGRIPGLLSLEVGLDVNRSESARDVVLITEHEDGASLQAYQGHPAHLEAAGYIKGVTRDRVVVDFQG